jgi:cytochrome c biogenesis protein CcmG/thiol:disulfide interchange protein DsbE
MPGAGRDRRPIVAGLLAAAAATLILVAVVQFAGGANPGSSDSGLIARDQPAPRFSGTTLDGTTISLAELRGHPVIVNFWGPTCVPCRTEFPLLKAKLAAHAPDGLVVLGVLMADPPEPARTFVAEQGATWPTVIDPNGAIRNAYRVVARPQSYFIDRGGVLRAIQIGEVRDVDFERQYALIAGS